MKILSEGTRSILIGAHNIVHSYYVWKAWKLIYKKYPSFKETVCILLHDIGYIGMNYYTNKSNAGHAELGASIAYYLFGSEYALLILGHSHSACEEFGVPKSLLEMPDDYSWLIAPMWWHRICNIIEGFNNSPEEWVEAVRANFYSENKVSGTELAHRVRHTTNK